MLQPGLVLSKLAQGQELDLDKRSPQAGTSPRKLCDGWHGRDQAGGTEETPCLGIAGVSAIARLGVYF